MPPRSWGKLTRHQGEDTLGDSQWYFQMYRTEDPAQSFRQQWDWAGRFPSRFVISIRLGG